jgi:hypothetical protein
MKKHQVAKRMQRDLPAEQSAESRIKKAKSIGGSLSHTQWSPKRNAKKQREDRQDSFKQNHPDDRSGI